MESGTESVLAAGRRTRHNASVPSYHEYCPIAVGAEFFGDRWTPLVLRELLLGSTGFNEIHRGLGRMSRTLLLGRLRELERRGILERTVDEAGRTTEYRLTAAGRELEPIVWALGHWAARWSFGDPADEELDIGWVVWRLRQHLVVDRLPAGRTVVQFVVDGAGAGQAWLVLDRGESTACSIDPGFDVDLVVSADNRQLHRWLLGWQPLRDLQRTGDIRLIGPSRLVRAFPTWFGSAMFARSLRRGEERARAGMAGRGGVAGGSRPAPRPGVDVPAVAPAVPTP
jgi:DNA-binding HxlR family transcriptional regulator